MTTIWVIDEDVPPVEPPADSLAGEAAPELTAEDEDAILSGVDLPQDAEGGA
jgi:hypothetical protein